MTNPDDDFYSDFDIATGTSIVIARGTARGRIRIKTDGERLFVQVEGQPRVYEHIAKQAQGPWNTNGQMGLVVGATFPNEIAKVRQIVGDMPLLIPGIGAQGGDIEATVRAGRTADGTGMMINSSRAILYASRDKDFAAAARNVALQTRETINRYRHGDRKSTRLNSSH